jgi:hypothetical protein
MTGGSGEDRAASLHEGGGGEGGGVFLVCTESIFLSHTPKHTILLNKL